MAITPPYCIDNEELMSLKSLLEEDAATAAAGRDIEQMMRSYLSMPPAGEVAGRGGPPS
jgi:hypothetical protein